jgi:hypothetical protein
LTEPTVFGRSGIPCADEDIRIDQCDVLGGERR